MEPEGYAVLALICAIVLGLYAVMLRRRTRRREVSLNRLGFSKTGKQRSRHIEKALKVDSRGAFSLSLGSKVYVGSDMKGDLIVCDLITSVGLGRYSGFSKVTVLGFSADIGDRSDFLIRKSNLLETRFELRDALSLGHGWYVWCTKEADGDFDRLAWSANEFGSKAVLRKGENFLSLYFRNKYLDESEIDMLLPKWRKLCEYFIEGSPKSI